MPGGGVRTEKRLGDVFAEHFWHWSGSTLLGQEGQNKQLPISSEIIPVLPTKHNQQPSNKAKHHVKITRILWLINQPYASTGQILHIIRPVLRVLCIFQPLLVFTQKLLPSCAYSQGKGWDGKGQVGDQLLCEVRLSSGSQFGYSQATVKLVLAQGCWRIGNCCDGLWLERAHCQNEGCQSWGNPALWNCQQTRQNQTQLNPTNFRTLLPHPHLHCLFSLFVRLLTNFRTVPVVQITKRVIHPLISNPKTPSVFQVKWIKTLQITFLIS